MVNDKACAKEKCFCCHLLTFFKNVFQVHYQSVKQFGSRSGPKFCQSWSGSKLFAKVISRWQKSSLARKELLTCVCIPCIGIIIFTSWENKWSTWSDTTPDLFSKVQSTNIFLHYSLSEKRTKYKVHHNLSVTFHINYIVTHWSDKLCLSHCNIFIRSTWHSTFWMT